MPGECVIMGLSLIDPLANTPFSSASSFQPKAGNAHSQLCAIGQHRCRAFPLSIGDVAPVSCNAAVGGQHADIEGGPSSDRGALARFIVYGKAQPRRHWPVVTKSNHTTLVHTNCRVPKLTALSVNLTVPILCGLMLVRARLCGRVSLRIFITRNIVQIRPEMFHPEPVTLG